MGDILVRLISRPLDKTALGDNQETRSEFHLAPRDEKQRAATLDFASPANFTSLMAPVET